MALKIDELNNLTSAKVKRAIPFRQYFEEMDLEEEQISKRVEHSEKLSPILFFIITLVLIYIEYGYEDYEDIAEQLRQDYLELLGEEGVEIDQDILDYLEEFSKEFVETTVKRAEEEFFTSDDRADVVAENEANVIFNHEEFKEAIKEGKTYKIWVTEEDERVRDTHKAVNEKTIPIDEYFTVGDSYMLYPKDISLGASMTEIANCRCHIEYV